MKNEINLIGMVTALNEGSFTLTTSKRFRRGNKKIETYVAHEVHYSGTKLKKAIEEQVQKGYLVYAQCEFEASKGGNILIIREFKVLNEYNKNGQ